MSGAFMNRMLPRRLLLQAGLIVSLLLIAAISFSAGYTAMTQERSGIDSIMEQARITAKNLAEVSIASLLVEDLTSLETSVLKLTAFPDVLSILVCDAAGTVLSKAEGGGAAPPRAVYDEATVTPPADSIPVTEIARDRIVAWHPIKGRTHLGWVRVDHSLRPVMVLKRRVWRNAVLAGVPSVVLGISLILLFLRGPIRDIGRAGEFARKLNDRRGETISIEAGSLELEQLLTSLNLASLNIHDQDRSLRESERRYRTLFEGSKDGIFISTPDGDIIDINPAGAELFGYSSKEQLLKHWSSGDFFARQEDRWAFARLMEHQGFIKDHEIVLKRRNGDLVTVLVTATDVRNEEGRIIAHRGIVRDITSQKKLEMQLRHAQKMEAVGQLTGGIAHDFNNILTGIIGFGYILQMKMAKDDHLRPYAEQILAAAEKAANLTQSLLSFSTRQSAVLQPVDMAEVTQRLSTLLSKIIGEEIELVVEIAEEDLTVMGDSGQLEQVLMNLAANARDAMPGGGTLSIRCGMEEIDNAFILAHGYGQKGSYVCCSISDTGEGMDEGTVKRIFEPFFTTKEVGKGTGLGLSIVYGIVKQHHGYINVESEPGKGTAFKIYLPLIPEGQEATQPRELPARQGGTETVLIAEDDEEVRRFMRSVLSEFGYRVVEAKDGEAAVAVFAQDPEAVDLVVLDVVMPKKNGRTAYEEIRAVRPGIKALFMSGYTADIVHTRNILEQDMDFVSKPVSPTLLLKIVREILDR